MFTIKLFSNSRTLTNFSKTLLNSKKQVQGLLHIRNFSGSSSELKRSEFSNQTLSVNGILNLISKYNRKSTKLTRIGQNLSSKRTFSTLESEKQTQNNNINSTTTTTSKNETPIGKIEGKIFAQFTCNVCQSKVQKTFSKASYEHGVVLIRCDGCKNLHLVRNIICYFRVYFSFMFVFISCLFFFFVKKDCR